VEAARLDVLNFHRRFNDLLARPERFERPTPRFVVWCSRTKRQLIATSRLEPRPAGQAPDWFAEPAQRALCSTTALLILMWSCD
jgi:hypothetical protein